MKTITHFAVSLPVRQHSRQATALQQVRAKLGEIYRTGTERARERRRARKTAAALEHPVPRELRDIGVVRICDVRSSRYVRYDVFG